MLQQAIALYEQNPIYWAGVILWLFGFAAYVPAACGRGGLVLSKTGIVLCWLGFAVTVIAYLALDDRYRVPPFERPTLEPAYWLSSNTHIWLLWLTGSALILGSGLRWLTRLAGWLGLAAAMVGVIASWLTDETWRHATIRIGTAALVALLVVIVARGELHRRKVKPGDYEAELIVLCNGSRRRADRLIDDEMKRKPGLSRPGAALAVVTRLRHEQDPYPRPL